MNCRSRSLILIAVAADERSASNPAYCWIVKDGKQNLRQNVNDVIVVLVVSVLSMLKFRRIEHAICTQILVTT